ncbi:MAG: hypothetical protein V8S08_01570 [Lachnoclostridium sp.]
MAVPYMYDTGRHMQRSGDLPDGHGKRKERGLPYHHPRDGKRLLTSECQFPVIEDPGLETLQMTIFNIMETYARENHPNSNAAGSYRFLLCRQEQ